MATDVKVNVKYAAYTTVLHKLNMSPNKHYTTMYPNSIMLPCHVGA